MKNTTTLLPLIALLVLSFYNYNSFAQEGTWSQLNNYTGAPRNYAMEFTIADKAYVGGGLIDGGYTTDFWTYDAETDTWSQKADLNGGARFAGVGFSIGDKGYAGLGAHSGGIGRSDFWEYDPVINTWTQKADFLGLGKVTAVGFSIDDKGYVGTGSSSSSIGTETNHFWEYNPSTNAWTQKQSVGGGFRSRAVGFSMGAKGYIGTGYYFDGSSGIDYNDFWEYDPTNDIWLQKADFEGTSRSNAIGFTIGEKGFVGLGYDGLETVTDMWQFDPDLDDWIQMTSFPGVGRLASSVVTVGNRAYVGLGYYVMPPNIVVNLRDIWVYENPLLGINTQQSNGFIKVYPNPVAEVLYISAPNVIVNSVNIYSLSGKEMGSFQINNIDVANFSTGLYLIKISTDKGIYTENFIKK